MSPTPLIELQRRLAIAGAIRMGEKTYKGAPKRLTTFRITSPDESLVVQAAGFYGGKPGPWDSPNGAQFEVVTTASELPVLVMPGYSFSQAYEFRTSPTLVERRCDGVEMDDGRACQCNADGDDKCDLITRLVVALPELTTMLGWRLQTKGDNAAKELLASMDLVRGVAGGRPFVPAKLKIVERRSNVNGQPVRYVVPVIDVQVRYAEILGGGLTPQGGPTTALPAGSYTPLQAPKANGSSLAEGLEAAETQTVTRTKRSSAPIAVIDDVEFSGAPVPPDDAGASPSPRAVDQAASSDAPAPPSDRETKPATKAQKDKLNVLVGRLRDAGQIETLHLWKKLAASRYNLDPASAADKEALQARTDEMVILLGGKDEAGDLHWSPLRENLRRSEAHELIDALEGLESKVAV